MRVLGIDVGASKTECFLADGEGRLVASARGPGANVQLYDADEVEFILARLLGEVLGPRPHPVDALCAGVAGAGRPDDIDRVRRILDRIGCARRTLVTTDAVIALVAGAGRHYGVVLVVGTGAAAYGASRDGTTARSGGWGPLLGDEGSAYWMGLRALRAVVRASDGRGPQTMLAPLALERFGLDRVEALVPCVYRERSREEIAALAGLVQYAADRGDAAAQEIVDEAGRELVRAAESVIGRLELAGEPFPLVLAGGLWRAVPVLRVEVSSRLTRIAPRCSVRPLDVAPAWGAVRLALDAVAAPVAP